MAFFVIVIAICVLLYYLYLKLEENNTYWTNKRVVQYPPLPFFGNFAPLAFQKMPICDLFNRMYNQFPNARYFGIYQFLQPNLVLKDLDLIKRVTVKEFDTFPEHRTVVPEDIDPLFARNILFMKGGEKWQRLRSMLSPAFTSSKMKGMYPLVTKCVKQFLEHYEKNDGVVKLEFKETFSRYANDVIATVAFGVECNSFANQNDTFYLMGKNSISVSFLTIIKMFMFSISPFLMKLFKLTVLSREVSEFFRKIVKDTMKLREEKGIIRNDMIHLLNEARKGKMMYDEKENQSDTSFAVIEESEIGRKQKFKYSDISDDDLVAQAVVFYLAGFDTTSTALSFCAYELAINPDVQKKLREEIDQASSLADGDLISYDDLLKMKYLDMVVSESLRKWPSLIFVDRKAVKPFIIESELPGEETLHFNAETVCIIPIYSIQRDPKYYPNPDKFDPERFSDENKHQLVPFSFLPFGMGPKSCIGSRFALLEMKLILFNLIKKFEIVPVSETKIPMVTRKKGIFLAAEGGIWLGLKKRN